MTMPEVLQLDDQFPIVADVQRTPGPLRILKCGDTFGVFDQHGDVNGADADEQGLYYRGTRFLSTLELLLARRRPLFLSSTVSDDNVVLVADLTNTDVRREQRLELPRGEIHLFRSRVLGDHSCFERLRICNHSMRLVEIPLSIRFDADFADVFEVRGTRRARRGEQLPDWIGGSECVLSYAGLDGVERRTRLRWTRTPDVLERGLARFTFQLEPHAALAFEMHVSCEDGPATAPGPPDYEAAVSRARTIVAAQRASGAEVRSSNQSFNRWFHRSAADLRMMITPTPQGLYPYAGIPWFSTPFGRDGLITAFEMLWAHPDVARGVLAFLAATQATDYADAQDAEPGKILHEMRGGEMAALGEVPFGRYYGSIDSTPLFVMLAHAYYRRSGDRAFIDQLWPHLVAALDWMARDGDADRDGFIEYARHSENGLVQQGWKDSNDSVFHVDGTIPEGPIALCEVQGYAFAAWKGAADLADLRGDRASADAWRARAERLAAQFDAAFWCEDLGTYALALDGRKRPCRVRTSNPAHCLFTGIVPSHERARRLVATLMDETSFAGWGLRTVAATEARYNPMSYHNGSIWPHDNAIAAMGMARYGFMSAATRLLDSMLELSQSVELHRLPELICGFHRRTEEGPTLYPVACSPQAWAAGAVYLLLQASLGLDIDANRRCITFRQAALPETIERLRLTNLVVGDARVDLALERHANDVAVSIVNRVGDVELVGVK
jgi:glycogen debranching enzyme